MNSPPKNSKSTSRTIKTFPMYQSSSSSFTQVAKEIKPDRIQHNRDKEEPNSDISFDNEKHIWLV